MRIKKTGKALKFVDDNFCKTLVSSNVFDRQSLAVFSAETRVVNIALTIKIPQAIFSPTLFDIAKTGIKLSFVSCKTIDCNIYSIAPMKAQVMVATPTICLSLRFFPSFDMTTPAIKMSRQLYRIGFDMLNVDEKFSCEMREKISAIDMTIIGTSIAFAILILSIPSTTTTPDKSVIISPKKTGIFVSVVSINSPPAIIVQVDIREQIRIIKFVSLFFGIEWYFPPSKNKAHRRDINMLDTATFIGEQLPKKSAISRPEAKPAPITAPIYRKLTFNTFDILI